MFNFGLTTLDYKSCQGNDKPDRNLHISAGDINPATNKAYAINPSTGVWDDNYFGNVVNPAYKAANPSLSDFTQQATDARNAAIQPAVDALSAQKPITDQAYALKNTQLTAEVDPLKARYDQLLSDITGKEQASQNDLGKQLSTEYSARGIPLSSGVYQQDLFNKGEGLKQFYTGQTTTTSLEENSKLRDLQNMIDNLPVQKAQELNAIDTQIANLKASSGNSAITDALQQLRDEKQAAYNNQLLALEQQKVQISSAPQYSSVSIGGVPYSFNPATGQYTASGVTTGQTTTGGVPTPTPTPSPTEPKPTNYTQAQLNAFRDFGIIPPSFQSSQ